MKAYKGYLIDLDGTVYMGTEVIPAGKRFIERLQEKGIPFLFLTNNATTEPEKVRQRLEKMDIHVSVDTIYTVSLATVSYMKSLNLGNKVFVVGESGLINPILDAGFVIDEEKPDYVVAGLDREFNYEKAKKAVFGIQKGAHFIGTNPDKNLPSEQGFLPGGGSVIAMIETAAKTKPDIVGKPQSIIMDFALEKMGMQKSDVLMVGDNYETDILAGINNGIDSLLVFSGFTTPEDYEKQDKKSTYVIDNLDAWEI